MRALFKFITNRLVIKHQDDIARVKVSRPDTQDEDTESKLELQDEIFKLQQVQADVVKQVGKIVRTVNQEKPVRLNLARLVSK